jgi:hypothetical protein
MRRPRRSELARSDDRERRQAAGAADHLLSDAHRDARAGSAAASSAERIDAEAAVNKFAALGTYLANLRDEAIRARYTELARALEKAVADAGRTPPAELARLFEGPDRIFAELNNDCVKSAKE